MDAVKSPQSIQWHTNPRGSHNPVPVGFGQLLHHAHPPARRYGHSHDSQDQNDPQGHTHDHSHGQSTQEDQDRAHSIAHVGGGYSPKLYATDDKISDTTGFTESEIREIIEHAELTDIKYTVVGEYPIGGVSIELFVARGVASDEDL